jgi:hypothetical protein
MLLNDLCLPRLELAWDVLFRVLNLPDHAEEQPGKQGEDNPVLH